MNYLSLMSIVGDFGYYQKRFYFLVFAAIVPQVLQTMHMILLTEEPQFRCAVPGLANDTYHIQNEAHRELVNSFIPIDSDTSQYSHCEAYAGYWNGSDKFDSHSKVPCDRWVYDHNTAQNSLVPEFDLVCDRKIIKSHFDMALLAGKLVGSLLGGIASDYFGRRLTICIAATLWTPLVVGVAFAQTIIQVMLLKFIQVTFSMPCFLIFVVLVSEIVGPSKRGRLGIGIMLTSPVAIAVCIPIYYLCRSWRTAQLIVTLPNVLNLYMWWLVDESPRWLMIKNKTDQAMQVIRKMAKTNKVNKVSSLEDIDHIAGDQLTLNEAKVKQDKVWMILTNKVMLLRLTILALNWGVINMGYYTFSMNVGDIILRGDVYLNMLLQCLMEVISISLCMFCYGRIGRKALYCVCAFLAGIACLLDLIFRLAMAEYDKVSVEIVLTSVGRFGLVGTFALIYVVTVEILPTTSRSFGLGLCSVTGRILGVISPYIGQLGLLIRGKFGHEFTLFVIGASCILCGLSIFLLPEVRNEDLPDTIKDASGIQREKHKDPELQKIMYFLLKFKNASKDNFLK